MTAAAAKPIEILLVDDNPDDVLLARMAFQHAKVSNTVHVAKDGVDALEFLRREGAHAQAPRPDIVFLDLNMPRKNGREVLAELKADEALRQIPVVVLTTSSADEDVLRTYDLGANCYVTKPVDFDGLEKVVKAIDAFWFTVVRLPPK